MVRIPACHAGGPGFESRQPRHKEREMANKQAFPKSAIGHMGLDGQEGMDIRTWLAGMALAGISQEEYEDYHQIAMHAVGTADAVLKQLDK